MGIKIKRKKRSQEPRRMMTTIVLGDGNAEADDCPICQALGIDLDEVDGVDVRPIPEGLELEDLAALFGAAHHEAN